MFCSDLNLQIYLVVFYFSLLFPEYIFDLGFLSASFFFLS